MDHFRVTSVTVHRCSHYKHWSLNVMYTQYWDYCPVHIFAQYLVSALWIYTANWSFEGFGNVVELPNSHVVSIKPICHYIMLVHCSDWIFIQMCNFRCQHSWVVCITAWSIFCTIRAHSSNYIMVQKVIVSQYCSKCCTNMNFIVSAFVTK